ncbi:MAG: DUF4405 domain-containing protein [Myxococcaceae bacterium]
MKLKSFATPLAGAVFFIMAVTGLVMFFEAQTPAGKALHEYFGWLFVTGVVLHVTTNWASFKAHLGGWTFRGLLLVAVAMVVFTIVAPREPPGGNPMRAVIGVVSKSAVKDLAVLAKRDANELVAELQKAGFAGATVDSTPDALAGEDREKRAQVLGVLFPAPARREK